jgi:G3E family GTPase
MNAIPVILITGFLGAGKTTWINRLLQAPHGRRIAAIVNDFGAINIDARLLSQSTDTVIGLKNGCICCSLQGDLLRTLRTLLTREAAPDYIVIEASGVSDPSGIITAIQDPVLQQKLVLDSVVCLCDAETMAERPSMVDDRLWQAQVNASDFIVLNRDQSLAQEQQTIINAVFEGYPRKTLLRDHDAAALLPVFFSGGQRRYRAEEEPKLASTWQRVAENRFVTIEWTWALPIRLEGFQALIARISPQLIRAKGLLQCAQYPDSTVIFQMVGLRAQLTRVPLMENQTSQLVLIGEKHKMHVDEIKAHLRAL